MKGKIKNWLKENRDYWKILSFYFLIAFIIPAVFLFYLSSGDLLWIGFVWGVWASSITWWFIKLGKN
ncbi:MAG: hypothetical protein AAB757_01845 [Patescibacteria group bacterium]